MRKQFTTKDSITLHYEVFGDDGSPVILLIMGLGMPSVAWPPSFIQGLVQSGFRVITFDNRDSGKSTKIVENVGFLRVIGAICRTLLRLPVRAPYSLEDMAADAEAVLDELQVKRAHVLGISMGGMISQVMALNYPQRIASMISIMSASGNPRTGLGKLNAIRGILKPVSDERNVEAVAKHLKNLFKVISAGSQPHSDEHLYRVARSMVEDEYQAVASSRQLLAILASGDRSKNLRRIMAPTLVIHGRNDPLLPLRAGEEVAEFVPNARMLTIDKMGHDLSDNVVDQIVAAVSKHCHRYKD